MSRSSRYSIFRQIASCFLVVAGMMLFASSAFAQGGGDPGGGDPPVIIPPVVSESDNFAANDSTQVEPLELDLGADREPIEDDRFQGFIGATSTKLLENGFVGPAGITSVEALSDFGGGSNTIVGGAGGGGGRGGAAGRGFQAVQIPNNGFTFQRRGIRAAVRPVFRFPVVTGEAVANRFQSRLVITPATAKVSDQVKVSVVNKRATVTGTVATQEEADRVIGQLKLEPGVYGIVNNLQVGVARSTQ